MDWNVIIRRKEVLKCQQNKFKKYLIILILKIWETETDADNPITQKKITELISSTYPCDRKTVGRNIGFLKNVGYPIVKTSKGFYLNTKEFTVEEVDFIIKSVLESKEKTEESVKIFLKG